VNGRVETSVFTTAVASVMLFSQHPSTCTGAESIQLIYSGRAIDGFEFITLTLFACLFRMKIYVMLKKEKQLKQNSILPTSIYIHMYLFQIY